MKLPRPARSARGNDDLIPLINIVFLLLIFFMLAGNLRPPEPDAIDPPRIQQGAAASGDPPTVTLDRDGRLLHEGRAVPRAAQDDTIATLGTSELVRIRADHRVDSHILLTLVEELRRAGTREIELLSERVMTGPPSATAAP